MSIITIPSILLLTLGVISPMINGHFQDKHVWFKAGSEITEASGCAAPYGTRMVGGSIYHGKDIMFREHVVAGMAEGDGVSFCHGMIQGGDEAGAMWELKEFEVVLGNVIAKSITVCEEPADTDLDANIFFMETGVDYGTRCELFCKSANEYTIDSLVKFPFTHYLVNLQPAPEDGWAAVCTCLNNCDSEVTVPESAWISGETNAGSTDKSGLVLADGDCPAGNILAANWCFEQASGEQLTYGFVENISALDLDSCVSICKENGFQYASGLPGAASFMCHCWESNCVPIAAATPADAADLYDLDTCTL